MEYKYGRFFMLDTIHFWLSNNDNAPAYSKEKLDVQDIQRLQNTPNLVKSQDWQVSRWLKQTVREQYALHHYALSHKNHMAILAHTNTDIKMGVDLEWLKCRHFSELIPLFCSRAEQEWWLQQTDPKWAFYHLWCLKEALIKAENLSFPDDLRAVGLIPDQDGTMMLHSGSLKQWQGLSCCFNQYWIMAAVWPRLSQFPLCQYHWTTMQPMKQTRKIEYK